MFYMFLNIKHHTVNCHLFSLSSIKFLVFLQDLNIWHWTWLMIIWCNDLLFLAHDIWKKPKKKKQWLEVWISSGDLIGGRCNYRGPHPPPSPLKSGHMTAALMKLRCGWKLQRQNSKLHFRSINAFSGLPKARLCGSPLQRRSSTVGHLQSGRKRRCQARNSGWGLVQQSACFWTEKGRNR